jgi:hypothetical protein
MCSCEEVFVFGEFLKLSRKNIEKLAKFFVLFFRRAERSKAEIRWKTNEKLSQNIEIRSANIRCISEVFNPKRKASREKLPTV